MLSRQPPEGWDGAAAWQDEVEQVVRDEIRPAVGRYADLLAELLPRSRPPERAGLLHVPGGVAAYACSVRVGTTLPLDPEEIHHTGLTALAEIEEAIAELGRDALGTRSAAEAMARLRESTQSSSNGADAISPAAAAVSRAEERLTELFHDPMPPRCVVASRRRSTWPSSAAAVLLALPARDGSRPGAYLFNNVQPGQAGSWALEATAFMRQCPGITRSSPGCSSCLTCPCC